MNSGNSGGPTSSGTTAEAPTVLSPGDFIEELEYEHVMLHMMNNSVIRDATLALADGMGDADLSTREAERYRQLLADFYDNPDLTEADIPSLTAPEYNSAGLGPDHARRLIQERDRYLGDTGSLDSAAEQRYEAAVEAELENVRTQFEGFARRLNGDHDDGEELRSRIEEIDNAVAALQGQYERLNGQLNELRRDTEQMEGSELYGRLRAMSRDFDDWAVDHENDEVYGFLSSGGHLEDFLPNIFLRVGQSNAEALERYQTYLERRFEGHIQNLPSRYPDVYKHYNTLLAGGHVETWTEKWWNFARVALWIVGAEIAGRVVAAALAPITLGASVAVINVATQIGRTRVLGGAVSALARTPGARAAVRAGAAGLAAARWLLELPDRVVDLVLRKFANIVDNLRWVRVPARPSPASGSTVRGTPGSAAVANCCVRAR